MTLHSTTDDMNDFQRTIIIEERERDVGFSNFTWPTSPESVRDVELETASSHSIPVFTRPTGFRWFLIVISILIGLFLFALDNTILADVTPVIVEDFQAVDKVPWLATAFIIPGTALMLPVGQLFQVFNANWLYILGIIVFEIGSALCGGAPNINAFIIGRVVAGIGSTAIYTGSLFLISVNTSERERPSYIGLTGATWGLGTILGPIVGGALAHTGKFGWRWAFYINLPIGLIITPILIFLVPPFDARQGTPFKERIKNIDWIGSVLFAMMIAALFLGITFGGNQFPWDSAPVIAAFVSFGVLIILFAISQLSCMPFQSKEKRIFPVEMLYMRTTILLFILIATAGALTLVTIFYIPLYFQFTRGDSAIEAALRLLPVVLVLVCGTVIGGILLTKIRFYSPFYIFGSALGLAGSTLLYFSKVDTSVVKICGSAALVSFGSGIFSQVGFTVAQAKVPKHQMGQAIGFLTTGQLLGCVMALAIGGTLFIDTATTELSHLLPGLSVETIKNSIAGTATDFFKQLDPNVRQEALKIIVSSMDRVYIMTMIAGAVGLVCAVLLKHERLPEEEAPSSEKD